MKQLAQFAIGYLVILIFEKCAIVQNKHPCEIKKEEGHKTANCIKKQFITVPQDLDKDIQKLDLSGSKIKELNMDSFKEYTNLKILICENVIITDSIVDQNLFQPMTHLQEIYLKKIMLTKAPTFKWPSSIIILNITECLIENINLANAAHLKILDASSNELQDIPTFNELAPIKYVNLKENPLGAATVGSLAKACRVNHLDLLLTGNSDLKTQKLYCTCKAILDWIIMFNITTNIHEEEGSFSCNSWAAKDAKCDTNASTAALKIRDDCLAKSNSSFRNLLILIIIFIASILVLLVLLLFAYLYGSLRKKTEKGEVVEIHHGKSSPTVSEENTEEEEPSSDEPHMN